MKIYPNRFHFQIIVTFLLFIFSTETSLKAAEESVDKLLAELASAVSDQNQAVSDQDAMIETLEKFDALMDRLKQNEDALIRKYARAYNQLSPKEKEAKLIELGQQYDKAYLEVERLVSSLDPSPESLLRVTQLELEKADLQLRLSAFGPIGELDLSDESRVLIAGLMINRMGARPTSSDDDIYLPSDAENTTESVPSSDAE